MVEFFVRAAVALLSVVVLVSLWHARPWRRCHHPRPKHLRDWTGGSVWSCPSCGAKGESFEACPSVTTTWTGIRIHWRT